MSEKDFKGFWQSLFLPTPFYFMKITIAPLFFIALTTSFGWWLKSHVDKMVTQEREFNIVVQQTINDLATRELLLPKYVFIQGNDSINEGSRDSLSNRIAAALVDRFSGKKDSTIIRGDFQPHFLFAEKVQPDGSYQLTEEQLHQLKSHLRFLAETVESRVAEAKAETAKDIDRLNSWISIWIGVLGFFGVLIPIVINYAAVKKARKASKMAKDANLELKDMKSELVGVKSDVDAVKELKSDVERAHQVANAASIVAERAEQAAMRTDESANRANESASEAQRNSQNTACLLRLTNSLAPLRFSESSERYIKNKNEHLRVSLIDIKAAVSECTGMVNNPIVIGSLKELAIVIFGLSTLGRTIHTMSAIRAINVFAEWLAQQLEGPIEEGFLTEFSTRIDIVIAEFQPAIGE